MRNIPCHKIFVAHYEHFLSDPGAYFEPLSAFLELGSGAKTVCLVYLFGEKVIFLMGIFLGSES